MSKSPKPKPTKPRALSLTKPEDVEKFIASLDHPFNQEILAVREIILSADPSIEEGIKWNAPSFRTDEYFATMHLRAKEGVGVILHLGAKKRAIPSGGLGIADPESLLQWLAKDRAMATFRNVKDIAASDPRSRSSSASGSSMSRAGCLRQ